MAPGIATDPSVVLCGYGCHPALLGMTEPVYFHWDHMHFLYFVSICVENSFKEYLQSGREHCGGIAVTYKVRSLGMWLKLETGMLLMLLLFRVL